MPSEAVKAPDLTAQVVSYLNGILDPPVSGRVPNPRPAKFVRVTQVPSDGFDGYVLFHGRLVVEAWAPTDPDAYDLAAECEALLKTQFEIISGGPGRYPEDPLTGTPKAGFTAELYVRGTVA